MARDRKRAKQRRARRAQQAPARMAVERRAAAASDGDATSAPDPLEDASAEVEIAEAALAPDPQVEPVASFADDDPILAEEDVEPEAADDYDVAVERAPRGRAASVSERPGRQGSRFGNFLRACWAELNRVQWPDRRQVTQATGVVLGFVLIAGAYLGLLDAVFSRLVDRIL